MRQLHLPISLVKHIRTELKGRLRLAVALHQYHMLWAVIRLRGELDMPPAEVNHSSNSDSLQPLRRKPWYSALRPRAVHPNPTTARLREQVGLKTPRECSIAGRKQFTEPEIYRIAARLLQREPDLYSKRMAIQLLGHIQSSWPMYQQLRGTLTYVASRRWIKPFATRPMEHRQSAVQKLLGQRFQHWIMEARWLLETLQVVTSQIFVAERKLAILRFIQPCLKRWQNLVAEHVARLRHDKVLLWKQTQPQYIPIMYHDHPPKRRRLQGELRALLPRPPLTDEWSLPPAAIHLAGLGDQWKSENDVIQLTFVEPLTCQGTMDVDYC